VKRQFFRHGVVYAGANLISSMSSVLLVPIYTRALAPAEYGVVDYLSVVQSIVQICAGLEITQGIARFFSEAGSDSDRRAYASTGLWFLLASFATACVLLYLAALTFGAEYLGLGTQRSLIGVALASIFRPNPVLCAAKPITVGASLGFVLGGESRGGRGHRRVWWRISCSSDMQDSREYSPAWQRATASRALSVCFHCVVRISGCSMPESCVGCCAFRCRWCCPAWR
jgi:hypothetical protein